MPTKTGFKIQQFIKSKHILIKQLQVTKGWSFQGGKLKLWCQKFKKNCLKALDQFIREQLDKHWVTVPSCRQQECR